MKLKNKIKKVIVNLVQIVMIFQKVLKVAKIQTLHTKIK